MSKIAYRISQKAISDLEEIWLYSCTTWSKEQADRYYELLIHEFEYVAKYLREIYPGEIEVKYLGERASGMLVDRATIREHAGAEDASRVGQLWQRAEFVPEAGIADHETPSIRALLLASDTESCTCSVLSTLSTSLSLTTSPAVKRQ